MIKRVIKCIIVIPVCPRYHGQVHLDFCKGCENYIASYGGKSVECDYDPEADT